MWTTARYVENETFAIWHEEKKASDCDLQYLGTTVRALCPGRSLSELIISLRPRIVVLISPFAHSSRRIHSCANDQAPCDASSRTNGGGFDFSVP